MVVSGGSLPRWPSASSCESIFVTCCHETLQLSWTRGESENGLKLAGEELEWSECEKKRKEKKQGRLEAMVATMCVLTCWRWSLCMSGGGVGFVQV